MPKANHFIINMPLQPYGDSSASIKMNGVELTGVTSINATVGKNELSKIELGLECSFAIEMIAQYIPSIKKDEGLMIDIGHLLDDELPEAFNAEDYGEAFLKVLERMLSDLA